MFKAGFLKEDRPTGQRITEYWPIRVALVRHCGSIPQQERREGEFNGKGMKMPYAKRKVLAGFPSTNKFSDSASLDDYFGAEKVVCLLCGMQFSVLGTHLKHVHNTTSNKYREVYDIPSNRGLCSSRFSEVRAANEKIRRIIDPETDNRLRSHLSFLGDAGTTASSLSNKGKKMKRHWANDRTKYSDGAIKEFGRRVIGGRTYADVSRDADMPFVSSVVRRIKVDKDLGIWWESEVEPNRNKWVKK